MSNSSEGTSLKKAISASLATMTVTAAVVSFVFDRYVVPLAVLQTKSEFTDLSESSKKNEIENIELKSEIEKVRSQLIVKNDEVTATKEKISRLEIGNLFAPASPHPIGLGAIRIGNNIEAVKDIYEPEKIKWPDEANGEHKVEVQTENSFFTEISYIYEIKSRAIVGISYTTDFRTPAGLILSKLEDIFGMPTPSKPKGMYKWQFPSKLNSYLLTDDLYMVVMSDRAPILWPQDQ